MFHVFFSSPYILFVSSCSCVALCFGPCFSCFFVYVTHDMCCQDTDEMVVNFPSIKEVMRDLKGQALGLMVEALNTS